MEEYLTTNKWKPQELIECFPLAKDILPSLLEEREKSYQVERERIKSFIRYVYKEAPEQMWFWEIVTDKLMIPDLVKVEREVHRIKRLINTSHGRPYSYSQKSFENKLDNARAIPIEALARSHLELKSAGKNYVGLCPLHSEKSPSFYLYTETNSFYCFGCTEGGDVIKLTQKLYAIPFREAVELLQTI